MSIVGSIHQRSVVELSEVRDTVTHTTLCIHYQQTCNLISQFVSMYTDLGLCIDTGMGCDQGLCHLQMAILTGHV